MQKKTTQKANIQKTTQTNIIFFFLKEEEEHSEELQPIIDWISFCLYIILATSLSFNCWCSVGIWNDMLMRLIDPLSQ